MKTVYQVVINNETYLFHTKTAATDFFQRQREKLCGNLIEEQKKLWEEITKTAFSKGTLDPRWHNFVHTTGEINAIGKRAKIKEVTLHEEPGEALL